MLYVSRDSSFVSTQYLVLNLICWFGVLSNKFIIFDISLLYYYNSSLDCQYFFVFFFFLEKNYFSSVISLSVSLVTVSGLFCCEFFLYLIINLSSSTIYCLTSGDTYLSLGISLFLIICSFVSISEIFCCEFFEIF